MQPCLPKFKTQYRIASARLPNWDYGRNAAYFVTICTGNREHFFGNVLNNEMHLTEIGQLAHKFWAEIPQHFTFVHLGEFVIMPNHVHGIIIIDKSNDDIVQTPKLGVSTNQKWKPATLGVIINQYKRAVTIHARKINPQFAWQTRFHDHIIRDGQSFQRISQYIAQNPILWDKNCMRDSAH